MRSWPRTFRRSEVVQTAYGMADRAKARAATENIMAAHPNLRGLFADNESSSAGAVLALKCEGTPRYGWSRLTATISLLRICRTGYIDALVVQKPFQMGYESVKAIGRKLSGQRVVSRMDFRQYGKTSRFGEAGRDSVAASRYHDLAFATVRWHGIKG